jgi:chloramphenicol-sensitive protein RarD
MSAPARGVLAMIAACTIWGLSPIFYKQLAHVPPLELLSHRSFWSLIFFGAILLSQQRLGQVLRLLAGPRALVLVALAALMISANWFLFILSTQIGQVTQSSLGYYIFPLVAVVLGRVVLAERLGRAQKLAVALAATGVLVIAVGAGAAPWLSLSLALTFGFYGLIKTRMAAGPVISVTAETLLLAPIAIIWLWGVHVLGWTGLSGRNLAGFGADLTTSVLLIVSGPLTAGPLILFSYATRRVRLTTIGIVQYINPTLQFLCAMLIFGEGLGLWQAIAFGFIWVALAIYSVAAIRADQAGRRAASAAATVGTTVT